MPVIRNPKIHKAPRRDDTNVGDIRVRIIKPDTTKTKTKSDTIVVKAKVKE
jgi:hypothetical protein